MARGMTSSVKTSSAKTTSSPHGGKHDKPKKKPGSSTSKKVVEKTDSLSSTISYDSDISYDPDFDSASNFQMLKNHFEKILDQKVLLVKTECEAKIDALHEVIKNNYEAMGKLNREIGELRHSYSFLTDETTMLSGRIKSNECMLESATKNHNILEEKTSDLEDRSRRNNLVFYNFPEHNPQNSEPENCEAKLASFLKAKGFFDEDYGLEFDRVHRIGKKNNDTESRPRPIIARFCFYKDKQSVLQNGKLFKNCEITAREDFSKKTVSIHKQLHKHAIDAKEAFNNSDDNTQGKAIKHFKILYRRVLVTYTTNRNVPTAPTFSKSFNLQHISNNKYWYVPATRTTYSNVKSTH